MATRRPFFCGNWKLNGSIAESTRAFPSSGSMNVRVSM